MDDAGKIAERIRDSNVWSLEDCRALCHAVGLGEAWDDATAEDFEDSKNYGFLFLDGDKVRTRLFDGVSEHDLAGSNTLPKGLETLILTVKYKYAYLFH